MDSLPPIPIPPSQHWKEFKLRGVPALVFALCILATVKFWRQNVVTAYLVGEVVVVQANVTSLHAGTLSQLQVSNFQLVTKDQVLGQIVTTPPKVLEASLAVLRAEAEVLRSEMTPLLDQQRNAFSWEQLKLDWINHRLAAATSKVSLDFAETQYERNLKLYNDHLISQDVLEELKVNRDKLRVEFEEHSRISTELEPTLARMKQAGRFSQLEDPQQAIHASLALLEEKLKLTEAQMSPQQLIAPISGHVTTIFHNSGENLNAGEPVLTITSDKTEKITAFLRQPIMLEPHKGMQVEITTRSGKRERIDSSILEIGARWQPISQSLLRNGSTFESGLPILVAVPAQLKVRPGEIVDITLRETSPVSGN